MDSALVALSFSLLPAFSCDDSASPAAGPRSPNCPACVQCHSGGCFDTVFAEIAVRKS